MTIRTDIGVVRETPSPSVSVGGASSVASGITCAISSPVEEKTATIARGFFDRVRGLPSPTPLRPAGKTGMESLRGPKSETVKNPFTSTDPLQDRGKAVQQLIKDFPRHNITIATSRGPRTLETIADLDEVLEEVCPESFTTPNNDARRLIYTMCHQGPLALPTDSIRAAFVKAGIEGPAVGNIAGDEGRVTTSIVVTERCIKVSSVVRMEIKWLSPTADEVKRYALAAVEMDIPKVSPLGTPHSMRVNIVYL